MTRTPEFVPPQQSKARSPEKPNTEKVEADTELKLIDRLLEERRLMDDLLARLQGEADDASKLKVLRDLGSEINSARSSTDAVWNKWRMETRKLALPKSAEGRSAPVPGSGERMSGRYGHKILVSCGEGKEAREMSFEAWWTDDEFTVVCTPSGGLYSDSLPDRYWIGLSEQDASGRVSPPRWSPLSERAGVSRTSWSSDFDTLGLDPNKTKIVISLAVQSPDDRNI